jgi:hypothetical protein
MSSQTVNETLPLLVKAAQWLPIALPTSSSALFLHQCAHTQNQLDHILATGHALPSLMPRPPQITVAGE